MRMSKSEIGRKLVGAVSISLVATVVKGKDSYQPLISGSGLVGVQPIDGYGRILSFGTVDAAIKFVGSACPNNDIVVNLPVLEGVKLFKKPVYASLAAANAALKAKLMAEQLTITAARASVNTQVQGFVALGYDVSVIPAVKVKHTNAVDQLVALDAHLAWLAAEIPTL